jgi:hypothetical protein
MSEIVAEHTARADEEHQQLRLLVSEWQLLADLAFSDLVLWVPDRDPNVFWAAAQIRPTTGPTALADDVVGDLIAYAPEHLVSTAYLSGEIAQTSGGRLRYWVGLDHAVRDDVRVTSRSVAWIFGHRGASGHLRGLLSRRFRALRPVCIVMRITA